MSRKIPIIKIHECLLVSIQTELTDKLVCDLKDNVCEDIRKYNPKGLIIELSGVDVLDSYIARSIRDIIQVGMLMGVKSWIVGLDPSMAITLVEMDMQFTNVSTALNLERALDDFINDKEADLLFGEDKQFDYLEELIK